MEPALTPLVVGVTSHRDLAASEIGPVRQCVREFLLRLRHDFPELPLVVLSALADVGVVSEGQPATDARQATTKR